MSFEFKSVNPPGDGPHDRKLIQLNNDVDDSLFLNQIPLFNNQIPDFCKQLINEIIDDKIITIEQLNTILLAPNYIQIIIDYIVENEIDYYLENEYKMVEICLMKVPNGNPFIDFLNICIIPKCKEKSTQDLILNQCLRNIENPNYSDIFSSYVDKYPSEDIWPFVLRMNKGFANTAMNLLFQKKYPRNKKEVIDKIKSNPSIEDFLILGHLELTNEEFTNEDIYLYTLNTLRTSLACEGETEEAKAREAFIFIGDRMLETKTIYPEFISEAFNLINNGSIYQKQESIKFLYHIAPIFTKNIILDMINNNAVETILDIIDSDSLSSVVECSLNLILLFFANFKAETLRHLDVEYLTNALDSINDPSQSCKLVIDKIFSVIQSFE